MNCKNNLNEFFLGIANATFMNYENAEGQEMFSKELLELDRNTVKLMIDDMQKEIDCQREQLSQKDKEMLEMRKEIQRLQQLLDKK